MSNYLILASSPRENGNSDKLAEAFYEGALSAGQKAKILYIRNMTVGGCKGCEYCYEHNGACCQMDDMQTVYKYLDDTDVIVFATPIYFQAFPSQLKAVIDRLYVTENRSFPIKGAVLLATYASQGKEMSEATISYYKTLVAYHGWANLGIVVKDCMDDPSDIDENEVLNVAFNLGASIEVCS